MLNYKIKKLDHVCMYMCVCTDTKKPHIDVCVYLHTHTYKHIQGLFKKS